MILESRDLIDQRSQYFITLAELCCITDNGHLANHRGLDKATTLLLVYIHCPLSLKWYYDQNIISFFSSDYESIFAKHLTGKILSFVF